MKSNESILCTPLSFLFLREEFELNICEYLLYVYFLTSKNQIFNESTFYNDIRKTINYTDYKLKTAMIKLDRQGFLKYATKSVSKLVKLGKLMDRQFNENQIIVVVNKVKFKEAYNNWIERFKNEKNKLKIINDEIMDFIKNSFPKSHHPESIKLFEQKRKLDSDYSDDIEDIDFEIMLIENKLKILKSEKDKINNEYNDESAKIKAKMDSLPKVIKYEKQHKEFDKVNIKLQKTKKEIEDKIELIKIDEIDIPSEIIKEYKLTFDSFCWLQFVNKNKKSSTATNDIQYLIILLLIAQAIRENQSEIWILQSRLEEILNLRNNTINTHLVALKESDLITFKYYPNYNKTLITFKWKNINKEMKDYDNKIVDKKQRKFDYSNDIFNLGFISSRFSKESKVTQRRSSKRLANATNAPINPEILHGLANEFDEIINEEDVIDPFIRLIEDELEDL